MAARPGDQRGEDRRETAVYLQYADHARWSLLEDAGVDLDALRHAGLGPVTLETTIRFRQELRLGDAVGVSCAFEWPGGRTGNVSQELHREHDGGLIAQITSVTGLLDLDTRRLVPDPGGRWHQFARHPEKLGLE